MKHVVAVIPQNMATDPRFADLPKVVSILHTPIDCPGCGAACWIGPKQREAVDAGLGTPLCYLCVFQLMEAEVVQDMPMISLDPNADSVPRKQL